MPSGASAREISAPLRCAHCGAKVPEALRDSGFCCTGCEAVFGLLRAERLDRFYALAGNKTLPVGAAPAPSTHTWLEPILAAAAEGANGGDVCSVDLDVQGVHCAGCVWLMNETFRRSPGAVSVTVNPALGKVRLVYRRERANIMEWVAAVERFGYRFGPSRKRATSDTSSLTWRLGLCVALSMNAMLLSISFYFGLSSADAVLFPLFTWLSAVLCAAVVIIGGQPFIRSAYQGLRQGILALDLPMALGIILVFATSVAQVLTGRGGDLTYFDTLNTFVTLMIFGRWLQHRVIERNRTLLLQDDGAEDLFVRRLDATGPHAVRAPALRQHDRILVAPGEIVPVEARLLSADGTVSMDWITGESVPHAIRQGAIVAAGGFNAGKSPLVLQACTDFSQSRLSLLLRTPAPLQSPTKIRIWDQLGRWWSIAVLLLAASGFALWCLIDRDRALDVTVALLVVTCPCAIGVSLPLARELMHLRLRRVGFFPRDPNLLDKLVATRTLIFDKTGTLTLGRLEVANRHELLTLPQATRDVAFSLAAQSAHPVASCLATALRAAGGTWDASLTVREETGAGLCAEAASGTWRLGKASFALLDAAADDEGTVLSRDGQLVARLCTQEVLRVDAAQNLRNLREAGFDVFIMSGDKRNRVNNMAQKLSLPADHALAELSPEAKAAHVEALGAGTLYLGDGVNDTLAFDRANLAGTVAVDRPILPGRSHFFLLGEGLQGLSAALLGARELRRVIKRLLTLSVGYNVVAVAACLAGVMTPLRAAISMPASSLALLALTVAALHPNRTREALRVRPLQEATCP